LIRIVGAARAGQRVQVADCRYFSIGSIARVDEFEEVTNLLGNPRRRTSQLTSEDRSSSDLIE
jgi:hypothetical protein